MLQAGEWAVLAPGGFQGEIDRYCAPGLKVEIKERVDSGELRLIVDLSQIRFVEATALGVLIGSHKRIRGLGGKLRIVASHPDILKTLEITGLNETFDIYPDLESAKSSRPEV